MKVSFRGLNTGINPADHALVPTEDVGARLDLPSPAAWMSNAAARSAHAPPRLACRRRSSAWTSCPGTWAGYCGRIVKFANASVLIFG